MLTFFLLPTEWCCLLKLYINISSIVMHSSAPTCIFQSVRRTKKKKSRSSPSATIGMIMTDATRRHIGPSDTGETRSESGDVTTPPLPGVVAKEAPHIGNVSSLRIRQDVPIRCVRNLPYPPLCQCISFRNLHYPFLCQICNHKSQRGGTKIFHKKEMNCRK